MYSQEKDYCTCSSSCWASFAALSRSSSLALASAVLLRSTQAPRSSTSLPASPSVFIFRSFSCSILLSFCLQTGSRSLASAGDFQSQTARYGVNTYDLTRSATSASFSFLAASARSAAAEAAAFPSSELLFSARGFKPSDIRTLQKSECLRHATI